MSTSRFSTKYKPVADNKEDQKSLSLVVEKLPTQKQSSSKTKQPPLKSHSALTKCKNKTAPQSYDNRGWIKPTKTRTGRNYSILPKKNDNCKELPEKFNNTDSSLAPTEQQKLTQSTEKSDKNSTILKRKKKHDLKSMEQKSIEDDFIKYGIKVPSFKEIVASKQKLENDIQNLNHLIEKIEPMPAHVNINFPPEPVKDKVTLDCKHLSELDINNACENNYQYISEIHNGSRYSKRQELYRSNRQQNNFSFNDLRYNTSMITFTYKQKEQLLGFLTEKFCYNWKKNFKQDDYFFKVLLPELCFKIFMDSHEMNTIEAIEYLENQPLY